MPDKPEPLQWPFPRFDENGKLVMPKPPPKRQTRKEKYDALEEEVGRGTVAFR